jgi:xanthine dehydrogenase small subunit
VIQFILNRQLVQLNQFEASATLLDYLRLDKKLTGTKEGCASGDCGACTVTIAEPNPLTGKLRYKSLNSCICLLGSLHGKHVITVDGLRPDHQTLHPVQQAMVDQHASQCGFCTPGFVMSLFALSKSKTNINRPQIIESIDGNLCRCTGYRPIIDAATTLLASPYSDQFDQTEKETLKILESIPPVENQPITDSNFLFPQTADELAELLQLNPNAKLLAGGTDLGLEITQGLQQFETIIYLGQVAELTSFKENDQTLSIGAALSYTEAESILSDLYPDLNEHLNRLGSLQIRNVATIGGNVANASPIGDMPPVLMALDADLVLQKGNQLRTLSINNFYTGYKETCLEIGEFIREIIIPKNKPNHHLKIYKVSKRHADDISAVCAAFYLEINKGKVKSARIAFGGMAATVKHASHCEQALLNQTINAKTLEQAKSEIIKDFQPLDDVRATKKYRLLIAQNLLQRLFTTLSGLEDV